MSEELWFAPFSRPLRAPFSYGNRTVGVREGFVLRKSVAGEFLYAEASPLPGHSIDTLAAVEQALRRASAAQLLVNSPDQKDLPPSLRFALESLEPLRPGKFPVRANALLPWEGIEKARARLEQIESAGFTHCKVKLSAQNLEFQLSLLEEFPRIRFRLDANLQLSAETLDRLIRLLGARGLLSQVDYLEEPFCGVWEMSSFRDSPLPLAADESSPGPAQALELLEAANAPSVYIVKPTVAGGLLSLNPFFGKLKAAGKRVVITSALEMEPGRRAILTLLSQNQSEVSGLATGHLFRENFLVDLPLWSEIPAPSQKEAKFLGSLAWAKVP